MLVKKRDPQSTFMLDCDVCLIDVTVEGLKADKWGKEPQPKVRIGREGWYLGHLCHLPNSCTVFSFATADKLSYIFGPWYLLSKLKTFLH